MRSLTAGVYLRQVDGKLWGRIALVAVFALAILSLLISPALAEGGLTPEQEKKARNLEGKLIAPCCWTQTVADHSSEASDQIKAEIRMLVVQGSPDKEIVNNFVDRYGEKILAAPAAKGFNLTAYVLPFLGLVLAGVILVFAALRWRSHPEEPVAVTVESRLDPERTAWDERLSEDLKRFDD
jgi:cytochrome c-type biogenesis protein CcmH